MFKKITMTAILPALLPVILLAQSRPLIFPDGTRVCFAGNSITMNGEFVHYVRAFYANRYPDKKVNREKLSCSGNGLRWSRNCMR